MYNVRDLFTENMFDALTWEDITTWNAPLGLDILQGLGYNAKSQHTLTYGFIVDVYGYVVIPTNLYYVSIPLQPFVNLMDHFLVLQWMLR